MSTPPRQTARALSHLLFEARAYWQFAIDRDAPKAVLWRCASCGRDTHAQSPTDSRYCVRCAPKSDWRAAPFGRVRKVSPAVAARWKYDWTAAPFGHIRHIKAAIGETWEADDDT
jgi:hypothetical protein